ncbi:unnamed protein product [Cuscuta epithymum]|uniref:Phytocyanin domain-containing protein n=1 Tax=Cuscuta epithymum TaxID=186058 RepID=A0AAV0EQT1_9ASTE|nr:unnamed protein product [Cuscuta epithymum]
MAGKCRHQQGRGSAGVMSSSCAAAAAVVLCLLLLPAEMAEAAVYSLPPWTFSFKGNNGARYKAGDSLVFKYPKGTHNVVAVSKETYDKCGAPRLGVDKVLTSGNDVFTLKKGPNYFICSFPGHCAGGMKYMVNAA